MFNEWYARDIFHKVRSPQRLRGSAGVPLSLPLYGYRKDPDNPKCWVIDEEAVAVVRRIYQLCIDGFGVEKTAAILEQDKFLKPTEYWKSKGVRKPEKHPPSGIVPTAGAKPRLKKSFWRVSMWAIPSISRPIPNHSRTNGGMRTRKKTMQSLKTPMRRLSTARHGKWCSVSGQERSADSRRILKSICSPGFYTVPIAAASSISMSTTRTRSFNNCCGNHGTCNSTHYIRDDALEEVVLLELRRMTQFLQDKEENFVKRLMDKSLQEAQRGNERQENEVASMIARCHELDPLFTKTYEDNASGELSDERFMMITKRYDDEQIALKKKISALQAEIDAEKRNKSSAANFLRMVHKYTEIKELTPTIANELIAKIVVHQAQGTGRSKTQQFEIYYNFVGVLDMPQVMALPQSVTMDTRQGVAVEYITRKVE